MEMSICFAQSGWMLSDFLFRIFIVVLVTFFSMYEFSREVGRENVLPLMA